MRIDFSPMHKVFGWWVIALSTCVGCSEPDTAERAEVTPDCMQGCTLDAPCALPRDGACEFADPSPWIAVHTGVAPPDDLRDTRTEILGFPAKHAGKADPVLISEGAYDEELVLSWSYAISPDGEMLVFDASSAHFEGELEAKSRMFVSELGAGVPSVARAIEGVPVGAGLAVDSWDPESRGFTLRSGPAAHVFFPVIGELYLVRREGNVLTPSLIAPLSEQVWQSWPCYGADHVAYYTDSDDFVIRSLAGDDVFRMNEGLEDVITSYDSKWLALTTLDENERYELVLRACGEGENIPLMQGLEFPSNAEFSKTSRYVAVDDDDAFPSYFELSDPSTQRFFPEGVDYFYAWALDESFALLSNEDGDLLAYFLDTGETTLVREEIESFSTLGGLVMFDETDDEDRTTRFELLDPRDPTHVLASVHASEGAWISGLILDPVRNQVVFAEEAEASARAVVLELGTGHELARFEFPSARGFSLQEFVPDGSGIIAKDDASEVSLYFLPLLAEDKKPVLLTRGSFGDLIGVQSWP